MLLQVCHNRKVPIRAHRGARQIFQLMQNIRQKQKWHLAATLPRKIEVTFDALCSNEQLNRK